MAHANARLTVHGRRLLVERVRVQGRPVAHVARELGVSRQCAHRWARRYDVPRLAKRDPLTGRRIRATRHTTVRYEHDRPGTLLHIDVKKIGRIPDGGWRAHGRGGSRLTHHKHARIGYDYVHAAVDDHTRLAYAEIHPDEKGPTAAASCAEPPPSSPPTASGASSGSSPTTPGATTATAATSPPHSPPWTHATSSYARTAPDRTARSNASTAPWPPSGPTGRYSGGPGPQARRAAGATALEQARGAGKFTPVHDAWWAAASKAHGDREGTRALIDVLLLNRQMNHEHVVAGIAAALRAGALTPDAVALEARKAAESDDSADVPAPEPAAPAKAATVTSLTERRLAQLPPDRRPLPSVAHYDQLLRRRPPASQGPTSQEEAR